MENWNVHPLVSSSVKSTKEHNHSFKQETMQRTKKIIEQFFENTNPEAGIRSILISTRLILAECQTRRGIDLNFLNYHLNFSKKKPMMVSRIKDEGGVELNIQIKDITTLNHLLGQFKTKINNTGIHTEQLINYVNIDSKNPTKINMILSLGDAKTVLDALNNISSFSNEMNAAVSNWNSIIEQHMVCDTVTSSVFAKPQTDDQLISSEQAPEIKLR